MGFKSFHLLPGLMQAITDLGYETPSEIQAQAIPILIKSETDFIGQAQTGTGKTAAFVLPLLQTMDHSSRNVECLILAPTRELANQVQNEIVKLSRHVPVKSLAVYGGTSYIAQLQGLRKDCPQIVVGTPGRVLDLIEKGALKLDNCKTLILDEADEMLNMGFFEDVQTIMSKVPKERRLWMFSATMPKPIADMINREFKDPQFVSISRKNISNNDIEQRYYIVKPKYRFEALCRLLDSETDVYGIVFCKTRVETREIGQNLAARGMNVETLHGEMDQKERDHAMAKFKAKKVRLLVCTDVAARGIDVNNLTHVINYGLPQEYESYVHRIGRTGRAGSKGVSMTLIELKELSGIRRIQDIIQKEITHCKLPSVEDFKVSLITKHLELMGPIIEAISDKGEEFKIDDTFSVYKECLKDLSREDLLKLFFSFSFNRELRRYTDIGDLDDVPRPRGGFESRSGGSRGHRGGGGFRRGNDRGFSRDGDRGGDRKRDGGSDRNSRRPSGGFKNKTFTPRPSDGGAKSYTTKKATPQK